jgi:hypothetical protein
VRTHRYTASFSRRKEIDVAGSHPAHFDALPQKQRRNVDDISFEARQANSHSFFSISVNSSMCHAIGRHDFGQADRRWGKRPLDLIC